ncbi:MAG: hypothetical protein SFW67_35665 [Myxococcaceae bacterium]|nr:hypothetical protein [Myxococcaceae bacterium]
MIRVRLPTGDVEWDEAQFKRAVIEKTVPPTTAVSLDGGATWSAALVVFRQRFAGSSDDALGVLIPVKVEPTALAAGYLSLGSLLLFGGPLTAVAALLLADHGPAFGVKVGVFVAALLLGVLPPIGLGVLAKRRVAATPGSKGLGRAWFSVGIGVLLALVLLAGVAAALVG